MHSLAITRKNLSHTHELTTEDKAPLIIVFGRGLYISVNVLTISSQQSASLQLTTMLAGMYCNRFRPSVHCSTARRYASAVYLYTVVVCPSVCLSVISWYCVETSNTQTTPHDSQFSFIKDLREIPPVLPHTGAPNAGGKAKNRRHSTNDSLHL